VVDDGQAPHPHGDPPAELLAAARRTTPSWVRRSVERAAARGGVAANSLDRGELEILVQRTSEQILADLAELLASDVDDQRTNPLTIFRGAVGGLTEFLRIQQIPPPPSDRFLAERFPDDAYQLGPATWSDIDDELHTPGLIWSAWKAKTVLDRRREEGRR
jgi:hypothetical protein